jgi:surface carbohydrate biosynthesis protein
MNIKLLSRKLVLFFQIFIFSKKIFRKPKFHDIVLYDFTCPSTLKKLLSKYDVCILHLRGEEINWSILIRAMVKKEFWLSDPILCYAITFIKIVNPKIVLTYIDNSSRFYAIKDTLPNVKTICIQNGSRSIMGDVFDSLVITRKFKVDYFFVHNTPIGEKFNEFIDTVVIPHGSLILNSLELNRSVVPGRIAFISQSKSHGDEDSIMFYRSNDKPVYFEEFYQAERFNLRFLNDWCKINNKNLIIIGSSIEHEGKERNFFSQILGDSEFCFIPRTDEFSSYNLIQSAEIVVFIDSTLGYESYGLRKKTAAFSNRMTKNGVKNPFGWPTDFDENGLFWTNQQNTLELNRIMNYLNSVSNEEWLETLNSLIHLIMEFDPGNSKLTKLIDELLEK